MGVLYDSRNQLRSLRRRFRRQTPSGGSQVLRAAEAKNREENDSQKNKADSEASAFAEAFGQINAKNYAYNEVDEWDKH